MTKCYRLEDHKYETIEVAVKNADKELYFKSAVRALAQLHNKTAPGSPVYGVADNGVRGRSLQNFWKQRVSSKIIKNSIHVCRYAHCSVVDIHSL